MTTHPPEEERIVTQTISGESSWSGGIRKMVGASGERVQYRLPIGEHSVPVNELVGQRVRIQYEGAIHCVHCQRKTNKSFAQGYCYPCFKRLAQCDQCILSPERCHYHLGTCREPEWGETYCMQSHYVYLANSSGLKVGITRGTNVPGRWIDQGASQAMPIMKVQTRYQSGLAEVIFKGHVADKTNWRAMLKGPPPALDLKEQWLALKDACADQLEQLQEQFGEDAIQLCDDSAEAHFEYPVIRYPEKVSSHNLDKTPEVTGELWGIKGQYWIFDTGVINIRKYSGYKIRIDVL